MKVVGFDFGTTNSLVSIIRGNRAINLLDDQGMPTPSVVCYEGEKIIVGHPAKERLGKAGLGVQGNIIRSPKTLLGKSSIFVDGVERSPVDAVASVVDFVCKQAVAGRRVKDIDRIESAVVTIPINMEGYRRAALRDAFRMARVGIVQFIHEPLAALYAYLRGSEDYAAQLRQYDGKLMVVFDWGGGTLDLTLCRLVSGRLFQIANDGTDEVGGDVFDDALRNEVIRRVIEKRGYQEAVSFHPDASTRLLHNCERAKIDLSTRNTVEIYVGSFFRGVANEELDHTLTRSDVESITSTLLNKGLSRLKRLLDAAELSPAQISLCLATGGMANMPAIRERLHEWFGAQRVHVSERSQTLIAEGAAWVAHDNARLHLSKNVELSLARNSYLSLVPSGTEMPMEGAVFKQMFHMYCTDPRDGIAKFELVSPVKPGRMILPNDQRNSLGNLMVDVDAMAKPFRERLELDIEINDDLILSAKARSLNKRGHADAQVHNLEFGLTLPTPEEPAGNHGKPEPDENENENEPINQSERTTGHAVGAVTLRINVADRESDYLVPGELLYTYNSAYFDTRRMPPRVQVEEKLYYEPCAVCRRASNDPLCRCGSLLPT